MRHKETTMTQTKKTDDIRMNLASHDAVADRLEGLKASFPEAFVEGKVDLERLRQHLGDFSHVGTERFGLTWAGKAEAVRALQIPSHGTLMPLRKESVNFDESENMIIEGDNLEVLKLLQKSYHGKIKMIYIDPPYNTGGDFIYPDNFKEGLETYLRYSGQATEEGFKATTNAESNGRYHSNWLSMMYPRLFMAKNLLRDDGVIFVSINDSELANLRLVLDEIYGADQFLSTFVWQSKKGGGSDSSTFVSDHEYVICYARNAAKLSLNRILIEAEELDKTDDKGPYRRGRELNKWGSGARRQDRPTMWFPITGPNGEEVWPIRNDGSEGRWRFGRKQMLQKVKDQDIEFVGRGDGSYIAYQKIRVKKDRLKPHRTWLVDTGTTADGSKSVKALFEDKNIFDFPKPIDLLKKIIEVGASEEDDIVLDFFAGSGSTAQAVFEKNEEDGLNRKFILVQLPEKTDPKSNAFMEGYKDLAHLCRDRVKKFLAGQSSKKSEKLDFSEEGQDAGFQAFCLSSSNFKLWDAANAPKDVETLAQTLELFADNVLPDRSQEDILYEVILKSGQPLTAKIEKIKVAKQQIFSINDGAMLVCLEDPLEEATLRGMLDLKPAVMVALDKAFHGNDQLKTNIKLQAESTGESEQSRVLFKTV